MSASLSALIYRRFDLQRDLAALVSLLQQVEQADQVGEVVTEAILREQLTWTRQDPALMTWVVTLPDNTSLVGYGRIQKAAHDENADLHIAVHPSWRRQGIGSHIFARLLERATELGTRALRAYADVQNEEANRFVRTLGFSPVSSYTRLSVSAKHPFPAPVLPQGFSTRSPEMAGCPAHASLTTHCHSLASSSGAYDPRTRILGGYSWYPRALPFPRIPRD